MKARIIFAVIAFATVCAFASSGAKNTDSKQSTTEKMMHFESVRDSLYDASMTICTKLLDNDGSYAYDVLDEETIDIIKTYRVPNLSVLLQAMSKLDEDCDLADVYDGVELQIYDRTLAEYQRLLSEK